MSTLYVQLFGKIRVWRDGQTLYGFDARKAQELFCYLLLNRDHPHSRETLADLFWGNSPTAQSKRSFRQTLWQLQAALVSNTSTSEEVLLVEPGWVQISPNADLWSDVQVFQVAYRQIQKTPGQNIDDLTAQTVQGALQLYKGDLLETWYQDWCLFERERLQNIWFSMLDKMMSYCEAHHEYEAGLSYGECILRYDRAHERTHAKMMRLYHLSGDRTAALRQYQRCVAALDQELGVRPTHSTEMVYKQICAGQLGGPTGVSPDVNVVSSPASVPQVLKHLKQVQSVLMDTHRQLQEDLQALEQTLSGQL